MVLEDKLVTSGTNNIIVQIVETDDNENTAYQKAYSTGHNKNMSLKNVHTANCLYQKFSDLKQQT